jgi:hypothetical protein
LLYKPTPAAFKLKPESPFGHWRIQTKGNTLARVKIPVRARGDAKPAITGAKERTPAKEKADAPPISHPERRAG